MLSCAKASPHPPSSNTIALGLSDDTSSRALVSFEQDVSSSLVSSLTDSDSAAPDSDKDEEEVRRRSYIVRMDGEPDSVSVSSGKALAAVNVTVADDCRGDEPHDCYQQPTQQGGGEDSFRSPIQENRGDMATDIIICTMVVAFVALQYRDIIQTCQ